LILCVIFIAEVDDGQRKNFKVVADDVSWAEPMRSVTSLPLMGFQRTTQLPSGGDPVWYERGSRLDKGSLGDVLVNMNYSIGQN